MFKKRKFYGMLAALFANIIFGFSFIFSKSALAITEPMVILAVRFTTAFITLNLLLLTGKFKVSFKNKPKLPIIAMGIAQPLCYFILELYWLSLVSSALSGVIISLVPVGATLLGIVFLKEKPTLAQGICTLISITAVALMSILSNDASKNHILGIFLLIGAVICAAVFNLLSRSQAENYSAFERTYIMFLLATIGFNIIGFATLKGNYIPSVISALADPSFIISILYLAVLSSVAAFLMYNFATSEINLIEAASFSNMITVVTVLAGVIILNEHFSVLEYILCAIIILSVWGVNTLTKKES